MCREIHAINDSIGKKNTQTGSWRSSFDLLYENGYAAQAEKLANDALQESIKDKSLARKATAEDLLARTLLAQGRSAQAQEIVARGAIHAQNSKDRHTVLALRITNARINAARGNTATAERELASVVDEANKVGFVDLRLDGNMAIADLDLRRGERDQARVLLASLQADATAHGFNLTAAKAEKSRHSNAPRKPQSRDNE